MAGIVTAPVLLFLALTALVAAFVAWAIASSRRATALRRMGVTDALQPPDDGSDEPFGTGLPRWLGIAGYRTAAAPVLFVFACVLAAVTGVALMAATRATGTFAAMEEGLDSIPGNFGQVLVPLLQAMPWMLLVACAAVPFLVVRGSRRRRVSATERELPVFLELLATLAEAGLGFDASISEILESDQGRGYIADEFRTFQRETLSGVPRVLCLRRLARRVDVPAFSTFISVFVQAERSGLGLSDVLRVQADDMRNRRRENALAKAQALPVKLVFPLVLCFLPALFVLTLGPAFHSFFRVADAVTGNIRK